MKAERVLVDTSAWFLAFRPTGPAELKAFLKNAIARGEAAVCPIIIVELIQGCRTTTEKAEMRSTLESLILLPINELVWDTAANLAFSLRRKSLTVPTVDIIIAAAAMTHDCLVLNSDKHFDLIAESTDLRTRAF